MSAVNDFHADNEHIRRIKVVAEGASLKNHEFIEKSNAVNDDILSVLPRLITEDKAQKSEVLRELNNEESIFAVINQERIKDCEQEAKHSELRELEEKEVALKVEIEHLERNIKNLEHPADRNKAHITKQKLEKYRNLAKASKKLTSTSFDYQSTNVVGLISGEHSIQTFNYNPSKHVSNRMWESLKVAAAADWTDIFRDNEMKTAGG